MNNELEDLMLEYLLRKKLSKETSYKPTVTKAPQIKSIKRRGSRHKWVAQDFQKVAFLVRQGHTPQYIAAQMDLRTQQIISVIIAMQGKNHKWNAPHLLVDHS